MYLFENWYSIWRNNMILLSNFKFKSNMWVNFDFILIYFERLTAKLSYFVYIWQTTFSDWKWLTKNVFLSKHGHWNHLTYTKNETFSWKAKVYLFLTFVSFSLPSNKYGNLLCSSIYPNLCFRLFETKL